MPAAIPTSSPTFEDKDYLRLDLYHAFVQETSALSKNSSNVLFSHFYYKGVDVHSDQSLWVNYTYNSLAMNIPTYYFSEVHMGYKVYDYNTGEYSNQSATCTKSALVKQLGDALQQNIQAHFICDNRWWRVYQCDGISIMCIDCVRKCPVCPAYEYSTWIYKVCMTGHFAQSSIINFQVSKVIQYPEFNSISIESVSSTSIALKLNVTQPGTFHCAAFNEGYKLPNTHTVLINPAIGVAQLSTPIPYLFWVDRIPTSTYYLGNVVVQNLGPNTNYDIYCVSKSLLGYIIDFPTVLKTKISSTTMCCYQIHPQIYHASVSEYVPKSMTDSFVVPQIFSFALNAQPINLLITSKVVINPVLCIGQTRIYSNTSAVAVPSSFAYLNNASTHMNFVIKGSAGCYTVFLKSVENGRTIANYSTNVRILSSLQSRLPPQMSSAAFLSSGNLVLVHFDLATNVANLPISFNCSRLLVFKLSDKTLCRWKSSTVIQIVLLTIHQVPSESYLLNIGDNITLIGGLLLSSASNSSEFSLNQTIRIIGPETMATIPSTVLSTSYYTSICDDIVLDATSSVGNLGRDWVSISWNVSGACDLYHYWDFGYDNWLTNISIIESYLNRHYTHTSNLTDLVVIPHELFSYAAVQLFGATKITFLTYTFSLTLTNFLGQRQTTSVSTQFTRNKNVRLIINGPSFVTTYRSQSLSLFSLLTLPECLSAKLPSFSLDYTWRVYLGNTFQQQIPSISKDPRFFTLAPYSNIQTGLTYSVNVFVRTIAAGKAFGAPIFQTVTLFVGSSGVLAEIAGGQLNRINLYNDAVLDASSSIDLDYPSAGTTHLTFAWTCIEYFPTFGTKLSLPLDTSHSSILIIPASSFGKASVVNCTVRVSNSYDMISSASSILEITNQSVPVIKTNPVARKYNPDSRIVINTSLNCSNSCSSYWICDKISNDKLRSVLLNPMNVSLPAGVYTNQLAVNLNILVPGISYTFTLFANYINQTFSYSSLIINVNSPPTGGILSISPVSGFALNTSFYWRTMSWSDDPNDYPLSYVMMYYADDPTVITVIKNIGTLQYVNAYLGQGIEKYGYALFCSVKSSDIYNCSSTVEMTITVKPIKSLLKLNETVQNILSSAFKLKDATLIGGVIGGASISLNRVNCSAAPACGSLNRYQCADLQNTCGECISGYFGELGPSNTLCQISNSVSSSRRLLNTDCLGPICATSMKTCPNSCSKKGICIFFDRNGQNNADQNGFRNVDICLVSNPFCVASCVCETGFYGEDCSLRLSSYANKMLMRESLCFSLVTASSMMSSTSDVLNSASTAITNLLRFPSQVSNNTINNCARAYLNLIKGDLSVASQDYTIELVLGTFSNILNYAKRFPNSVIDEIREILLEISTQRQSLLALNEHTNIITSNIRFFTSKTLYCDAQKSYFQPPLSGLEQYFGVNPTTVSLYKNQTGTAIDNPCSLSVGIGIIQHINNVRMIGRTFGLRHIREQSQNKAEWDLNKWVGYPHGEWYGTYDEDFPFANSSGIVFQFNSYDIGLPLPVSEICDYNCY